MCSNIQSTPDGKPFWCRNCDECIAARREIWVHRAVAEKATSAYTYCITLTYGNKTMKQRFGAAMFRYSDIQLFLKSLRQKIYREHKVRGQIRYICAGEQGDRSGRCHWHLVLYSTFDILRLGKFTTLSGVPTSDIVSQQGEKKRLHWDQWPHGMVLVQEPDEGGIRYALSYALKDQFAFGKTKGTKREAKSETWATGLFRMSKTPPIGLPYVDRLVDRLEERLAVLPNTRLSVEGLRGYWRPVGTIREHLLRRLRAINDRRRELEGCDSPQWRSLLAECAESESDMEILTDVKKTEGEDFNEWWEERKRLHSINQREDRQRRQAVRCGSTAACNRCLRSSTVDELDAHGIEAIAGPNGQKNFRFKSDDPRGERLAKAQKDYAKAGSGNPLCVVGNVN